MEGADEIVRRVVPRPWRMRALLSRFADAGEGLLATAGFDRGPWIAVAFAAGIGAWFWLDSPWQWCAAIGAMVLAALAALAIWRGREDRSHFLAAVVAMALVGAGGTALVWVRSVMVGAEPIDAPRFERIDARILSRENQPAEDRIRLVVATRHASTGSAVAYRLNLPSENDRGEFREGARIRLAVRLMPPSPPLVPGSYNFARRAWFEGLSATGSVVGEVELVERAPEGSDPMAALQRRLSDHVRTQLNGGPGAIAATLASGDRGAIAPADEEAMRDSGLTHLLSISGLHVSAVMAACYLLTLKLLALWPWLALRLRLPLVAAIAAAVGGIGYTLLTGAEVPTIRSCVGAVLVLLALALGREPLSLRMVTVAAIIVLALWPEALVGPSFQMSFAAVLSIVALHNSRPIAKFLAPRDEGLPRRWGRRLAVLFLTGVVIELTLMPVVLFHFHRAGVYGAFANLAAIPLVTFVSMPLVALALVLDFTGLGEPVWWLAGKSLEGLLAIAHLVAAQPNSVTLAPQMSMGTIALFVAGGLWLALWQGRKRVFGLLPIGIAGMSMGLTPAPDVIVARDGRDVGIAGTDGRLFVLRDGDGGYARDNLIEAAALGGETVTLSDWAGGQCSDDFCAVRLERQGSKWHLLIARNRNLVEERALAAACEKADVVIAARYLPRSCRPRWVLMDRRFLDREGGASLYLDDGRIETVARSEGEHGWWRPKERAWKGRATVDAKALSTRANAGPTSNLGPTENQ